MGERGYQKASGFSWVDYAKSVESLLHDLGARSTIQERPVTVPQPGQ
jgi:hypothetical protein